MRKGPYQSKKENNHQIYGKRFEKFAERIGQNLVKWLNAPKEDKE